MKTRKQKAKRMTKPAKYINQKKKQPGSPLKQNLCAVTKLSYGGDYSTKLNYICWTRSISDLEIKRTLCILMMLTLFLLYHSHIL